MPATRSLTRIGWNSEAAGSGAGMLAAPNAHEVSPQLLPGSCAQEVLVWANVQRQLSWIEESEGEAIQHYASNVLQQKVLSRNAKNEERGHFKIPKRLSQRHRGLLGATSEDLARGTVRELKCQLCPSAGFSNWEDFRRHCNFMEAHPLKILFCRHCGDFFARSDSLERHQKNRPPECHDVTPAEAEVKRMETKRVHEAFKKRLEQCLETDERIGTPFAQIIKAMYPNSSKRGSRQQCRVKESKA
jgi:hypothetical protein